ncbi:MAG TPA: sulfite dehydrogenase [Thermomicrobiales bacterium]|nr:sulfite dehydrogenase [Thermomicrobiales bacterium]
MNPLKDEDRDRSSSTEGDPDPTVSRRTLLLTAGAAGGAALVGAELGAGPHLAAAQGATPTAAVPPADAVPPAIPPWTREWGPLPSEYGARSPFEDDVVRDPSATSSRSPLADLRGIITPNSLFYERHHAGVPQIDPSEHRLIIHGMVDRPVEFTLDDIKRFPSVSVIHFLECSGNTGSEWKESTIRETVQKTHGLVSATEWTGVPMKTLLKEAGIQPGGTWLLCEGADAAALTRSIPTEKAMEDGLLVYGQNGEALRPEQGYPMRAIWPGFEGNSNVKWLRRIKVGNQPWETREETSKYTDLLADGVARQFTFFMEAKSVITSPSGGQTIPAQGFWEISGIAWSGHGKITMVEVSTDGGATWEEADLQGPVLPICLTRFRYPWTWDGQATKILSRATDETGYVQPTVDALVQARGVNSTYHMNAIKTWAVAENGEVTNVYQ